MSRQSGSERTEKATKRKREKAREQGQVAKSNDVGIAFSVTLLFCLVYVCWDEFFNSALAVVGKYLSPGFLVLSSRKISAASVINTYVGALTDIFTIIWPVLLFSVLIAVLANVAQSGLRFTGNAIMPKFSRINPLEGMKRIFSGRSVLELMKSVLKVTCLTYFVFEEYSEAMSRFPAMMRQDVGTAFGGIMKTSLMLGVKLGAVLAVLAAADYFFQRRRYEKDLLMTKQEVREEYKQLEGDPKIKARIRSKQRQMSRMRMIRRVQEADVVITNPTHYAVAVRYREKEDRAPLVLAKGKDKLAMKIKEKAREHGIEIVENKPVAQALYQNCEIEQEIPRDLYQAVAEILVYVYRMKDKTAKGVSR